MRIQSSKTAAIPSSFAAPRARAVEPRVSLRNSLVSARFCGPAFRGAARANEFVGTTSRSEHVSTEHALLASQIEQLPDLTGYLKYASEPAWHRVRLDARAAWEDVRRAGPSAAANATARTARARSVPARSHEGHGHE